MRYKIRPCKINNDATVTEGKRTQLFITPQQLQVGGIYNLRPGRFYRVIEEVSDCASI